MRPLWHVTAAGGLGIIIYAVTGSGSDAILAGASSILMDVDHAIEHLVWSRRPLSVKTFMGKYNAFTWPRIIFFLHSYEFIVLAALLAWWLGLPWLYYIVIGMFVHIIMDEIGNRSPISVGSIAPGFYFFLYRLYHGFNPRTLLWPEDMNEFLVSQKNRQDLSDREKPHERV